MVHSICVQLIRIDRFVVCGSANLNDRSQQGDRDSEVAVVIEDPATRESRMNGNQVHPSLYTSK
jgi:phospholipase D1/2